jgi:hypothetical protein
MGIADVIIAHGYCDHSNHGHDDVIITRGYCEYIILNEF